MIKKWLEHLKKSYITQQSNLADMPDFPETELIAKRLIFSGNVQGVGFRQQFSLIAKKVGVTGWVRNLPDGRVESLVQGTEEKIAFLISYMQQQKRLFIRDVAEEQRDVSSELSHFSILY
ncbi:acylphosphatase [Vagococcus acidifermentans]|nr:acylphosphatase [Vagococcus acidifermentans]